MRKIALLLWLLITTLLASHYSGFMPLKTGEWAKYKIITQKGTNTLLLKFLGTKSYKGVKVNIVEMVMGDIINQIWSAVGDDRIIKKMITKTPQGIVCMSEEMVGKQEEPLYHTRTPKEYAPQKPKIRFGHYILPNGKKLDVAIFPTKEGEVWVSSEVPFGIVLVKEDGKTVMKLIDFGKGAKPSIPLQELQECNPPLLPFPNL